MVPHSPLVNSFPRSPSLNGAPTIIIFVLCLLFLMNAILLKIHLWKTIIFFSMLILASPVQPIEFRILYCDVDFFWLAKLAEFWSFTDQSHMEMSRWFAEILMRIYWLALGVASYIIQCDCELCNWMEICSIKLLLYSVT